MSRRWTISPKGSLSRPYQTWNLRVHMD